MLKFLKSVNLKQDKGLQLYNDLIQKVKTKYQEESKLVEIQYDVINSPHMPIYENDFLEPDKMINYLEYGKKKYIDVTEYIDIIEHILLNPMTPENVKNFYINNFSRLLVLKIVSYKASIANHTSFVNISKILISKNLEMLTKERCEQTQHLINDYEHMRTLIPK